MALGDAGKTAPRNRHNGKWIPSPDAAKRDGQAVEMRAAGRSLREIAEHLGYYDASAVRQAINKRMEQYVAPAVSELRKEQDAQIDELYSAVVEVLEAKHLKVVNGAVVFDPTTGGLMEDDAPVLRAADTARQLLARRAALHGLDAPTKVQAQVQNVRVTVDGAEDV